MTTVIREPGWPALYSLIRLNFDLMTGFSLGPLQWFSMLGILVSLGSAALFVLLRIVYIGLYVGNKASLRSLVWFAALCVNVAILFAG